MSALDRRVFARGVVMVRTTELRIAKHRVALAVLLLIHVVALTMPVTAQDTLTGAFEGIVSNSQTGDAVEGADVQIVNQQSGIVIQKRTDSKGRFFQGLLAPGLYVIRVSMNGFQTRE